MKITLLEETRLRYEPAPGPLTIDAPSPDAQFTPYQMVAGGLAVCTHSILASWATHQPGLSADDLSLEVRWSFAEKPHRLGTLDLAFDWPSLPADRLEVAKRVAERCPVHASFMHAPTMAIDGRAGAPPARAAAAGADAARPAEPQPA